MLGRMIVNLQRVKSVVDRHLGHGVAHKSGETTYFCPFCNHRKRKLSIKFDTQKWHCWVCNTGGLTVKSLLYKSDASADLVQEISDLCGTSSRVPTAHILRELVSLPVGFKPLHQASKEPAYKQALHYAIHERGLTGYDILRYHVGYCDEGPYAGMVILPSYDAEGRLNFYYGRSYYKEAIKHKNPPVSKDIIGFESQINWREPVTIVEGGFDAITAKRNTIPLFSKKIMGNLRSRIVREGVRELYICLDSDALKTAIKEVEYFMNNGVEVHLLQLQGKDPNEVGYEAMTEARLCSTPCTFLDLVKLKMAA